MDQLKGKYFVSLHPHYHGFIFYVDEKGQLFQIPFEHHDHDPVAYLHGPFGSSMIEELSQSHYILLHTQVLDIDPKPQ